MCDEMWERVQELEHELASYAAIVEKLQKMLREADRVATYYRYHQAMGR